MEGKIFLELIERLRGLCVLPVQSGWRFCRQDLAIGQLDASAVESWPLVELNEKGYFAWEKGFEVVWLVQKITVPALLNGYPLEGMALRLGLTWWAEQAEVYVNGVLVQEGDLFDFAPRVLLSEGVSPALEFLVALRLVSPGHDGGALMNSCCFYASANPALLDPAFVADELASLQALMIGGGAGCAAENNIQDLQKNVNPLFLSVLPALIEWEILPDREKFDTSLALFRSKILDYKIGLGNRSISLGKCLEEIKNYQVLWVGHAHLDMAWLWPVEETWRVAEKTFMSVLKLQQEFPDWVFCHSTPALYEWVEKNRPQLFAEIQKQVMAGRWEVVGGMWVEPDLNLISAESLVRQVLYGQRYCLEKFGRLMSICWVPDTFGFCASLPQVLKQGGVEFFVTQKLRWNDTTKFPYGVFWWEGLDGTKILSVMSGLIGEGMEPVKIAEYVAEWSKQTDLNVCLWLPGVGDHGGGPTRDMLELASRWQLSPFFPQLKSVSVEGFLSTIIERLALSENLGNFELSKSVQLFETSQNLDVLLASENVADVPASQKLDISDTSQNLVVSPVSPKLDISQTSQKLDNFQTSQNLVDVPVSLKLDSSETSEKLDISDTSQKLDNFQTSQNLVDVPVSEKLDNSQTSKNLVDVPVSLKLDSSETSDKLDNFQTSQNLVDVPVSLKLDNIAASEKLDISDTSQKLDNFQTSQNLVDVPASQKLDISDTSEKLDSSQTSQNLVDVPVSLKLDVLPASEKLDISETYQNLDISETSQKLVDVPTSEKLDNSQAYQKLDNFQTSQNLVDVPVSEKLDISQTSQNLVDVPASEKLDNFQTSQNLEDVPASEKLDISQTSQNLVDVPASEKLDNSPAPKKLDNSQTSQNLEIQDSQKHKPQPIPNYKNELYLEFHRGCYTTHAQQKQANRNTENLLYQTEIFSALATIITQTTYPKQQIETLWKKALFNQFHDILPGTSIPEVYSQANQDWQQIQQTATTLLNQALNTIAAQIQQPPPPQTNALPILIFNPLNWQRAEVVTLPLPPDSNQNFHITDIQGNIIPSQKSSQNQILFYANNIPAIGYNFYWLCPTPQTPEKEYIGAHLLHHPYETKIAHPSENVKQKWQLENENLQIEINPQTGNIQQIYDKNNHKKILGQQEANQLQAFQDKGQYWDAWNIDPNYEQNPLPPPQLESIQWIEKGNIQQRLRIIKKLDKSQIQQDYILEKNSPLLKIETHINWQQKNTLLKANFPLKIEAEKATYEIAAGAIERTTQPQTPSEKAKWEVSAHRWADLTQTTPETYGISLLNNSKYGYDAKPNQLRISLLRSPTWPDPQTDQGEHQFTYAIYPHTGTWQQAQTVNKGYELNQPLIILNNPPKPNLQPKLKPRSSLLNLSPKNLILIALKIAEDQQNTWILRCYEAQGSQTQLTIESDLNLKIGEPVDILEKPVNNKDPLKIAPWKIATFKISAGAKNCLNLE